MRIVLDLKHDNDERMKHIPDGPSCRWEPLTGALAPPFVENRKNEENDVSKTCTTEVIGTGI